MSKLIMSNNLKEAMKRENYKIEGTKYFRMPTDEDLRGNEDNFMETDYSSKAKLQPSFRMPTDEDLRENEDNFRKTDYSKKEEVQEYLKTIVKSKIKYDREKYIDVAGGNSIVTWDKLKKMIEDGYNIFSAECLSVEPLMISIKYEKIVKKNQSGRSR